jgi:hypothetical protein
LTTGKLKPQKVKTSDQEQNMTLKTIFNACNVAVEVIKRKRSYGLRHSDQSSSRSKEDVL